MNDRKPYTLLDLLKDFAAAETIWRRHDDPTLVAAAVRFQGGRTLLLVERTYREGVAFIADPTEAELTIARDGSLWDIWNSERSIHLFDLL